MIKKVLIISLPRSGSTFVYESLATYMLKNDSKSHRWFMKNDLTNLLDEPFTTELRDREMFLNRLERISNLDSWVVKHLVDQTCHMNTDILSRLHRESDRVVILKRNHIDQILSLAVAEKLNSFGYKNPTLELTRSEIKQACWDVSLNRFKLNQCFGDKVINYENLHYPRQIVSEVLDLDINTIKPFEIPIRKSHTNIVNRDECLEWIKNYYLPRFWNMGSLN